MGGSELGPPNSTCMKTVAEFADIAVFLSAATSLRLQGALLTARNRFCNANITQPAYITIENFFNSINKGSKKFRKIIDQRMEKSADPTTLRTVTTYAMLTGTTVPNVYSIKMCLGFWNCNWLSNDFRNFLYLLRTNGLMLNNRLNAIDPTVPVTCNFCWIIDRDTEQRNSFPHFFYTCHISNRLLGQWCTNFEPQIDLDSEDFIKLYWYGIPPEGIPASELIPLISDLFNFILWKFKSLGKEYLTTRLSLRNSTLHSLPLLHKASEPGQLC